MLSAQKLKKELELNAELTELLEVLKGIASSQFRALEKKKERFATFLDAFEGFFQMIDFSSINHPFAKDTSEKLGIIMVTSDEGFMGGLNTRVINTALNYTGAREAQLIVIGERGAGYLSGLGHNFVKFPGIIGEERYELAVKLKDYIMKEGSSGKFSRLILVYPKPISFTVQKIEVIKILPCSELFSPVIAGRPKEIPLPSLRGATEGGDEAIPDGLGTGSAIPKSQIASAPAVPRNDEEVIIESSLSSIIEFLLGAWITEKLFEVFEDSKLSEFSARTVHLEESHQVLLQRGRHIQFQYFRSHHDLVDRGMRETFSAQLIRKK